MPSLEGIPCVWPPLAFSCFHCTKSTTKASIIGIIGIKNKQSGYDFTSKPHWYQVTHVPL